MNHESTFPVQSEIAPGVVFRFNKPTAVRRAALLLMTAEIRESVRKLLAEGKAIAAQPEDQRNTERFDTVVQLVRAQVSGAMDVMYLQWGLSSVEALTIDDTVPDVNTFIGKAPDSLVQEALAQVHEMVTGGPLNDQALSSILVQ